MSQDRVAREERFCEAVNLKLRIYNKVHAIFSMLWMGVIYFLSAQPAESYPSLFWGADKIVHMALFGMLGVFLSLTFGLHRGRTSWRGVVFITVIVMLYGVSDEYHQSFVPGRNPGVDDIIADTIGGILAALLVQNRRIIHRQSALLLPVLKMAN